MRTPMKTLVAALSLLLLAAGVASAKPNADEAQAAREHYKRGTTLYDLGKYEEAIIEFQQAYEIKDDPVLLYNIAQSYRLANKYQDALRFYKTYLRKSPKAVNRDEVETKIADMENLIQQQARVASMPSVDAIPPKGDKPANIGAPPPRAEKPVAVAATNPPPRERPVERPAEQPTEKPAEQPTEKPAATTDGNEKADNPPLVGEAKTEKKPVENKPEEAPRPGRTLIIAGIVVAVVGVGAAAGGIAVNAIAGSDSSKQMTNSTFDPSLDSQGKTFNTLGPVLLGAGGALVVAGVVVAVLGVLKKPAEQPKVTLLPALGRDLAGASLTVRF
jgi:hypothetical protein